MGKMITGSLCLTEINNMAKKGHSAFAKAQNGKIYVNITIWQNDEPDKMGNDFGIQLNNKKDQETEYTYIGNAKYVKQQEPQPLASNEAASEIPNDDDLPF